MTAACCQPEQALTCCPAASPRRCSGSGQLEMHSVASLSGVATSVLDSTATEIETPMLALC